MGEMDGRLTMVRSSEPVMKPSSAHSAQQLESEQNSECDGEGATKLIHCKCDHWRETEQDAKRDGVGR